MKIAIIGSGISGNFIAHHLHSKHQITIYESNEHVGGHTHTHNIEIKGVNYSIDTGFIVFNDWTYPHFTKLLKDLGVESQDSSMSFSVRNEKTGLEYNGKNINTLFAQRSNFIRPSFYRFISEILRFNRQAPKLLNHKNEIPLGQYLKQEKYSPHFINNYLIPMGSAIWSTDPVKMLDFPAQFFIRFFHNHGMLSIEDRPQWQVIRGGSARYVEKLVAPFREKIQLNTRVESVLRHHDRVVIAAYNQAPENYDAVFFACHSDQALKLIVDATPLEQSILGSIRYQPNEVVLHTDIKLLPHAKHAWAAWNYHVIPDENTQATLTYNMNILQNIQSQHTFCVTLNRTKSIDPNKIIKRLIYDHPLYTPAAATAQKRQHEINGVNRSFFCGAYWGNGFHEDGVVSSINALDHFNKKFNTYA